MSVSQQTRVSYEGEDCGLYYHFDADQYDREEVLLATIAEAWRALTNKDDGELVRRLGVGIPNTGEG